MLSVAKSLFKGSFLKVGSSLVVAPVVLGVPRPLVLDGSPPPTLVSSIERLSLGVAPSGRRLVPAELSSGRTDNSSRGGVGSRLGGSTRNPTRERPIPRNVGRYGLGTTPPYIEPQAKLGPMSSISTSASGRGCDGPLASQSESRTLGLCRVRWVVSRADSVGLAIPDAYILPCRLDSAAEEPAVS